ncbi:MAG: citramalate synthase [Alphaproteobacteria bacterium]|nr:citramalate synthase [Alphaproteobacteria bacterium]
MARRISLFDTTLRDGAQTQGVDFSVNDKIAIAHALDELGIDYIEGGWPGANPTDDAFFADPPALKHAKLTAFGMTRRAGRSAANDPGLTAVLSGDVAAVCLVGKCWDFHVDVALEISQEENIAMIAESVARAAASGKEPVFDAEHFFDGYKADPDFALACATAAHEAGARWVVLCDTNGGSLPSEVGRIVGQVSAHIPGDKLGIHAHNDTGNAVAISLAAVEAGATQVQGTINGVGERCGNTNLIALIPTLAKKYDGAYETGIGDDQLHRLTHVSRLLDELLNRAPDPHAAYVGDAAFSHKGGLHVSAVQKNPATYEHIDPELVGNRRHIVVSDQGGRANVLARLDEMGLHVEPDDARVASLVDDVKEKEHQGYSYDGAEASFELMAHRALGDVPDFYEVISLRTEVERRHNAKGELVTVSQAVIKIRVGGEEVMKAAEGNGPVDALDAALRAALLPTYPELADVRLVDFKVRILTPQQGTAAITRVMIASADTSGRRWSTVGISPNIIDAAYEALSDAITHKIYASRVAGKAVA